MAEQKVIMTDPRQEDYFYQEAIKTLRYSHPGTEWENRFRDYQIT